MNAAEKNLNNKHSAAKKMAITALFMLTLPAAAMPVQYNFSYDFVAGRIVEGTLWGELQADMNTVRVTDFSASYDTLAIPVSFIPAASLFPQTATLDGSFVKLFGLTSTPIYETVFFFEIDSELGAGVAGLDITSNTPFSFEGERFNAARWQLTAIDPAPQIPLPASIWLISIGFATLQLRRRMQYH